MSASIESSYFDISHLETLSTQDTPIHRLDPRVKFITTMIFVGCVASFGRHTVSGLLPYLLYPVVLVILGNLPAAYLLRKLLLAAPFVLFIGIFNPFFDRAVMLQIGPIGISGGWVSFASILLRFALTVSVALALIATTGLQGLGVAMHRLGAPRSFVVQLLFLYRYIFVLTQEAARMMRARTLRAGGNRGMVFGAAATLLGQLLLRTLDRAQRIHRAMNCRGFDGVIRIRHPLRIAVRDMGFMLGWSALFILWRWVDFPLWLGQLARSVPR